ncbi:Tad domain-containing protein, partial [Loktanella sp. DJP18]|uniref:Tad domain-containing protein n=1 Tax=Loktanella sp. DJP18 TaxID=3409788 RepID=UPI003BB58404
MMHKKSPSTSSRRSRLMAHALYLIRAEDGNLFIVFFPFLCVMAVWGGIAVDLMRFESRRAALQSVTDRATLAAANLDQSQNPADVVLDYFTKSGMADHLDGPPLISEGFKRREVTVKGQYDLETMFMRHINNVMFTGGDRPDWTTLSAASNSTAVQGVGAVEVSLVLDLSGSMYSVIKN